ncbi:uncharacterized protein [Ptychodera flava]|uniref:uncharacterized protein n=1 Tax=Ptychodera flava TaxID=63121 RepID=UPI003969ED7D
MTSVNVSVQNMTNGKFLGVYDNVSVKPGTSIYDIMVQLQSDGSTNFSFQATGAQPNHTITVINGLQEDTIKKLKWNYYINNSIGNKSVDAYNPADGSSIQWQYEHY